MILVEYIMTYFENTSLTPQTVKQYDSRLNEWISFLPQHFRNIICLIEFHEISLKALHDNLTVNTPTNRHNYIMPIISFMIHCRHNLSPLPQEKIDALRTRWKNILAENDAPIIQRRLQNAPTDHQLAKSGVHLSFNEIIAIRDKLPSGSSERLLICMYTMIPPVRADYFATQIVYNDDVPTFPNYIRISQDGSVVSTLTDFKTKRTYKQIVNHFPPCLAEELHASLAKFPRSFLFTNAKGVPYTRNSFTVWSSRHLTKVFEVEFTLVFFRHKYVTHFFETHDMNTTTDEDVKAISDRMGHSLEMFRGYKWVKSGMKGALELGGDDDEKDE